MGDFLGTGATFQADLNLVLQIAMGITLLVGMFLARAKRFTAHKYVQSVVVLGNVILIALIMARVFFRQVGPYIPANLGTSYYWVGTLHGIAGAIVEIFGLYVLLAAGTKILPERLRFRSYKLWMRTLLVSWWVVILLGLGLYHTWYMTPAHKSGLQAGPHGAHAYTILISNYKFTPKLVRITPGTTVTWTVVQGEHTVMPMTSAFPGSGVLAAGKSYRYTFTKPGAYPYDCAIHGTIMSAKIIVS